MYILQMTSLYFLFKSHSLMHFFFPPLFLRMWLGSGRGRRLQIQHLQLTGLWMALSCPALTWQTRAVSFWDGKLNGIKLVWNAVQKWSSLCGLANTGTVVQHMLQCLQEGLADVNFVVTMVFSYCWTPHLSSPLFLGGVDLQYLMPKANKAGEGQQVHRAPKCRIQRVISVSSS